VASGTFTVAGNTFKSVLENEYSMRQFGRDAKPAPVATVKPDHEPTHRPAARKRGRAIIGAYVLRENSNLVNAKVKAGEFRFRSDFTLSAVRYHLEHLEKRR